MLSVVTNKGVHDMGMEETQHGPGHIYDLLSELESIGKRDGKLLCVICRRDDTRLTLFDMLMNTLQVPLILLAPDKGLVYPSNSLNRRASALCVNV